MNPRCQRIDSELICFMNSRVLVRNNAFEPERDGRLIVAVCDTDFDNVPQPTLWNAYKRTPAHAVAYADGTRGLISPKQFRKLDLSGFIPAKELANALTTPPLQDTRN